jgi:hypothetical protein
VKTGQLKEFLAWRPQDEEERVLMFDAARARGRAALGAPDEAVTSVPTPVLLFNVLKEPADATEWLIEDLLAKGGLAMLSAEPYVGKSAIAGWLGLQVAAARNVLGTRTNGAVPVMYWQGEGSRGMFSRRLDGAAAKLDLEVAKLPLYMQSPGFLTDFSSPEFDDAVAAAAALKIKLIICDTLGYFFVGEENSAKDFKNLVVRPLKEAARRHGVAFLVIHHFGKPSETRSDQHKTRGTSAMFGDFDLFLRLERDKTDPAMRILYFDKIKDAPEREPLLLRFDKENGVFTEELAADVESRRLDEKATQEATKVAEATRKILSLITIHPGITSNEVASEVGVRKQVALKALDRLNAEGRVIQQRDGKKLGWHRSTTPAQRARLEESAKDGAQVPVPGGSR